MENLGSSRPGDASPTDIAELFEASATAIFEGQDGLIFHLEFDDAAKFGKFAEYLRAHGLLRVDRIQTKSERVH